MTEFLLYDFKAFDHGASLTGVVHEQLEVRCQLQRLHVKLNALRHYFASGDDVYNAQPRNLNKVAGNRIGDGVGFIHQYRWAMKQSRFKSGRAGGHQRGICLLQHFAGIIDHNRIMQRRTFDVTKHLFNQLFPVGGNRNNKADIQPTSLFYSQRSSKQTGQNPADFLFAAAGQQCNFFPFAPRERFPFLFTESGQVIHQRVSNKVDLQIDIFKHLDFEGKNNH